jgi:addiction module RelE/StbE family toxin
MKLQLTPTADRNLSLISRFLSERNPSASSRVREAIVHSMRTLVEFPYAGHEISPSIRRIIVPNFGYLIYYRVVEETDDVFILSIRHSSQKRLEG